MSRARATSSASTSARPTRALAYVDTAERRAPPVAAVPDPAGRRAGRGRGARRCCRRSCYLPAAERAAGRRARAAVGRGARRTPSARSPATHGAKVPDAARRRRPSRGCATRASIARAPLLPLAGAGDDGRQGLAGRGVGALPRAPRARRGTTRIAEDAPARRAGRPADRAGVVRRRRPRADRRRGRAQAGLRAASRCSRSRRPRSTPGSPRSGDGWRKQLKVGDVVLVCDVGGGTTDFSLIAVSEDERQPRARARRRRRPHPARRRQHGPRARPRACAQQLAAEGHEARRLAAARRWRTPAARAKEHAARRREPPRRRRSPSSAAARKVIGGTIADRARRAPTSRRCSSTASSRAVGGRRAPAARRAASACARSACPTPPTRRSRATSRAFLGRAPAGAPTARPVQRRRHQGRARCASASSRCSTRWCGAPEADPRCSRGTDLDLAVAHGAAYYGLVRRGKGVRIRGGTARAYYVGIESVDARGARACAPPLKALCVAPFGMEEGTEADAARPRVRPRRRRAGRVPLPRLDDAQGRRRRHAGRRRRRRARQELDPGRDARSAAEATRTPARSCRCTSRSHVTEVGTLELWCVARDGNAPLEARVQRPRESRLSGCRESRFVVGIDLGTTNSALAHVDAAGAARADRGRSTVAAAGRARRGRGRARRCRRSSTWPASTTCRRGALRCRGTRRRARDASSASSRAPRARRCRGAWSSSAKSWLCHPASIGWRRSCRGASGAAERRKRLAGRRVGARTSRTSPARGTPRTGRAARRRRT